MEQLISPLNQGLNPVRASGQWGQLVGLPASSPAIDSRVAQPLAAPLWLALQPYANARLCLFEVDRPESRSPVPIRRHVIDCFLEQAGIVGGYNDTALTDPGDVLLRGFPLSLINPAGEHQQHLRLAGGRVGLGHLRLS